MEKYELTKQKMTFGGKEGLKEYLTECMIDFTKNMNDGMLRLMWEGYIKQWLQEQKEEKLKKKKKLNEDI